MSSIALEELYIVLVEPSATQRRIICDLLRHEGVNQVEAVDSARSAFHYMKRYAPDLMITGLYLPDADAHELIGLMRADPNLVDVPAMVVSSEQNRENLEAVRQAGVIALLPKPFGRKDLDRALRTTIELLAGDELSLELYDVTELRVLVVDDSRMARRHMTRILQQIGIQNIEQAENGQEAIKVLEKSEAFDLICTDYNMPHMDGAAFTNFIRQSGLYAHIPIMMVTSEDDQARLSSVRQAGVSAICDKPFEVINVKHLITQLLDADAGA